MNPPHSDVSSALLENKAHHLKRERCAWLLCLGLVAACGILAVVIERKRGERWADKLALQAIHDVNADWIKAAITHKGPSHAWWPPGTAEWLDRGIDTYLKDRLKEARRYQRFQP